MFKVGKVLLIVDSVEKAVKFYTEKLLFSIVALECDEEGGVHLSKAEVRKGKFHVVFRLPSVDELAEFSMVRRCTGRSTAGIAIARKGIDSYYARCKKKGVESVVIKTGSSGAVSAFSIKDPFGFRLVFAEFDDMLANPKVFNRENFCGMDVSKESIVIKEDIDVPEDMIRWLKGLGISRRVAKKYIKLWAKKVY